MAQVQSDQGSPVKGSNNSENQLLTIPVDRNATDSSPTKPKTPRTLQREQELKERCERNQKKFTPVFFAVGCLGLIGIGLIGVSSKYVMTHFFPPDGSDRFDSNVFIYRSLGTFLGAVMAGICAAKSCPLLFNWLFGTVGQGLMYIAVAGGFYYKAETLCYAAVMVSGIGSALFNATAIGVMGVLNIPALGLAFSMGQGLSGFIVFLVGFIPLSHGILYGYMAFLLIVMVLASFFYLTLKQDSDVEKFLKGKFAPEKRENNVQNNSNENTETAIAVESTEAPNPEVVLTSENNTRYPLLENEASTNNNYQTVAEETNLSSNNDDEDAPLDKRQFFSNVWRILSACFLSSVVLFIIYPSLINFLDPADNGPFFALCEKLFFSDDMTELEKLNKMRVLFPQILIGAVNFFDILGRFSYKLLPAKKDWYALSMAILRIIFIPIFMFTAYRDTFVVRHRDALMNEVKAQNDIADKEVSEILKNSHHDVNTTLSANNDVPVPLMGDFGKITIVIIFALTTGWTTSAFLIGAPASVTRKKEKQLIGAALSLTVVTGLLVGAVLGKVLAGMVTK